VSAALHLARPEDLAKLMGLVAAFHAEAGLDVSDEARAAALAPLLEGSPHGAVYLVGPSKGPIGYIVVTFGWSVEFGGLDGFIDEIFIRPAIRGRGIASEVITSLCTMLKSVEMKALHLEVDPSTETAMRLYRRCHFRPREGYVLMSRVL
jgi:ribosomal protein S18 acetylase RimI-like enzyme